MGLLRRAYAQGGVINHCDEALTEALSYVYYDDGGLGPAEFVKESESARMTHGDRVIADALMLLGVEDAPVTHQGDPMPPGRSIGFRRRMALAKPRKGLVEWGARVDFSSGRPEIAGQRAS